MGLAQPLNPECQQKWGGAQSGCVVISFIVAWPQNNFGLSIRGLEMALANGC